ncbi:CBL-interacting protein kinase 23 [Porphyridium purpureum]|uniref:non-specific serine/threonine protein kinase n=1 Tax=Porphyridium purpureum TaxID=35688 RepID=A0A5J4YT55_PORPP|nr:CBL-interacting protein kinase 23 [Porphyridium purpureum]|eukprot:POR9748..scf227_4
MPVKVGKYLIGETLGQGAFGKVKLGKHTETGVQYAVKIIEKKEIAANSMAANVKREISIMRQLHHPNIVNFHEVLISKASLFIVMDLVKGDELYELLRKRGHLTERDAKHIFGQLVHGVAYCHEQGIYHRDLKPENILLDATSNVKITDFGMSAMTGLVNEAGNPNALLYTACGTLYYCAPEVLSNSTTGYNGEKVDAWSCGILLYLMLVGRLPFESEDMAALTKLIQSAPVKYPKSMDPMAMDLISRLLEKDQHKRITVREARQHNWIPKPTGENGSTNAAVSSAAPSKVPPLPSAASAPAATQANMTNRHSAQSLKTGEIPMPSEIKRGQSHSGVPQVVGMGVAASESMKSLGSDGTGDLSVKLAALSVYHGGGAPMMLKFMADTLPGKSDAKIKETVDKLAGADIECVEDLEGLAVELADRNAFKAFLTGEAGVPSVTAMRITQRLF